LVPQTFAAGIAELVSPTRAAKIAVLLRPQIPQLFTNFRNLPTFAIPARKTANANPQSAPNPKLGLVPQTFAAGIAELVSPTRAAKIAVKLRSEIKKVGMALEICGAEIKFGFGSERSSWNRKCSL
jgi:hypothetical protein